MEHQKTPFPVGLTFDDILLLPGFTDFSRSDIDLSTQLTKSISLKLPLISAPMDTVTESALAIALARLGGIGIIHRNLSIDDQATEVEKVKRENVLVGAAIGANKALPAARLPDGQGRQGFEDRAAALVKAGVDIVVVDSAHGFSRGVIDTISFIKKTHPKTQVIGGNIATFEGAEALIRAGADGLRVGMGPGAICTTRIISGMGVPQITAIMEVVKAARSSLRSSGRAIPVIADGGITYSGDMLKALAVGASTVMMGSFFASAEEAPGEIVTLKRDEVPHRFQSIFNHTKTEYKFKEYRGMGSVAAMQKGAQVKSEGEFHGKDYKERILVAEGVEGLVPIRGTIQEIVDQAVGGMKSGMYYVGARSIKELWQKAKFVQITHASLTESHPHSVLVKNPGKNYL